MKLGRLSGFRWPKLGAEHFVPKATRNTKAVLVVCIVVLEVVLLERFVVGWKAVTAFSIRRRAYRKHGDPRLVM